MKLQKYYESYRQLSYSNLNNQLSIATHKTQNSKTQRIGNTLKTVLPDITILQQCQPKDCQVYPERHIYGIQSHFIPVLCNITQNQTIINVQFNKINFAKMIKIYTEIYASTENKNKQSFKEKVAKQAYQILNKLHNQTTFSLQFIRENSRLIQNAIDFQLIQIQYTDNVQQLDPANKVIYALEDYQLKASTTLHLQDNLYIYHNTITTKQLWSNVSHIPDYQFKTYRSITLEYDIRKPNVNLVFLFEHDQQLQKTLDNFIIETRQEFGEVKKQIQIKK